MTEFAADSYSDGELRAEFDRLFPHGFGGADVVQELAPDGWENSPLVAAFHPSAEQLFEEAVRIHRNLLALRRPDDPGPLPAEPTLVEVANEHRTYPADPEREVPELVGQCLWDIFSDNHEVVAPDGRILDLGSFRAAGGFLADFQNDQPGTQGYDYLSFYLGTVYIAGRTDLGPVYRMIFRRLRRQRLDWVYHFPRIHLIDFAPLKEALRDTQEPDWLNYSPSEALAEEEARQERERQLAEMRESLDEAHREAIAEALEQPPPPTVGAYQAEYGRLPRGWPPAE